MCRRLARFRILLLLSILSMVLAPVAGRAMQTMVICSEGQEIVILADASGTPVDPLSPCDCPACAHCLPAAQATLGSAFSHQIRRSPAPAGLRAHFVVQDPVLTGVAPLARGPPARKESA